ncbi:hypothetical protein AS594_34465 [Streptomyces agglomeratus]|uniref:Uncharacterized protein n=1 Tax=Streptomyces agglomeratus TaxID=285458 RepID=A0A1E5PGZ1_9ACTN|nr:hypothetical protein AS594_34465 [Streptomyces agglomeratus]OEJ37130.1 hypothetical protein BGK70_02035 [Streptomyces agglomeratus]
MTGLMSSGSKLAAVAVSSATRIDGTLLRTTSFVGMCPSLSIDRSLASTCTSRAAAAVIVASSSALRSCSMPRSSSVVTFSSRMSWTCWRVNPSSLSAMTRLRRASWAAV